MRNPHGFSCLFWWLQALESNETDKGNHPAVTDISSSADGALIVVSIQR